MTSKIDGGLPPPRPADMATQAATQRAGEDRAQPIAAAPAIDSMRLTGEAAGLQALERELGAAPAGLDMARVNEVKSALADGSYRVDAQQIAVRMLAFEDRLIQ